MYKNIGASKNLGTYKNIGASQNLGAYKTLAHGKNYASANVGAAGKVGRDAEEWRIALLLGSAESAAADFSQAPLMVSFSSLLMC